MKVLSLILLFISISTYAQEQKYVDMSNMRQFNFGKCNGIDGNYIPNLSRSFYTAETCQDAYLKYDVCGIEASVFKDAFEVGASIENGKIVKKDIFLKEYKGQCNSWLKVRTRGCRTFIKREATKCGGKGKYKTGTNFFNQEKDGYTGLIKTKDILSYSESEYQIEQDKIAAKQERQRLAKLEQQRIEVEKQQQAEAYRLANAKSSDYRTVCAQEYADGDYETNLISTGGSSSEQICGIIKRYKIAINIAEKCLSNHSTRLTQGAINTLNAAIDEVQRTIVQNTQAAKQTFSNFYCSSGYTDGGSSGATDWGNTLVKVLNLYKDLKNKNNTSNSNNSGIDCTIGPGLRVPKGCCSGPYGCR